MNDYKDGWNTYVKGSPLNPIKSKSWKDGWLHASMEHGTYGERPEPI